MWAGLVGREAPLEGRERPRFAPPPGPAPAAPPAAPSRQLASPRPLAGREARLCEACCARLRLRRRLLWIQKSLSHALAPFPAWGAQMDGSGSLDARADSCRGHTTISVVLAEKPASRSLQKSLMISIMITLVPSSSLREKTNWGMKAFEVQEVPKKTNLPRSVSSRAHSYLQVVNKAGSEPPTLWLRFPTQLNEWREWSFPNINDLISFWASRWTSLAYRITWFTKLEKKKWLSCQHSPIR